MAMFKLDRVSYYADELQQTCIAVNEATVGLI